MRRPLSLSILALVSAAIFADQAAADFNPRGRQRKKPAAAGANRKPAPSRPAVPAASGKATEAPSSEALIQRYAGIVLNQPGAQFPLERLAQLYRERDGTLEKLLAEFEARVASAKDNARYNPLVALAGLYKQDGQYDQAIATYNRAITRAPSNPVAVLALARLYQDRSRQQEAKALFEQALPLLKVEADKEQTIRQLMTLSLELDDVNAARKYHRKLLSRAKGSFFVRAELGRELLTRERFSEAEEELRQVVKAAAGDNRALAPALRDLGRALSKQDKNEEALKTLRHALRITARESGLRRELLELIVEVYRSSEKLPELISLLEGENSSDFQELRLLGGLYEESGRIREAMKTYRSALKQKAGDLEVRLKLVQLLQIQGELDQAIVEYEALIKAAPHNPDYVFQLAEALLQRGDRKGALKHLVALERRSTGDEQTLAALVDFYERVGEEKRAFSLLEKLAGSATGDPQPIVELGDRYYQQGNNEKAKRTWKRLLVSVPNRARALSMLGDVYVEHDMIDEALAAFEEAIKLAPQERRYKKALALALERSATGESSANKRAQYEKARRIWEGLLAEASDDDHLAQEARQHIVTLWSLAGTLQMRISPLQRNLRASPPDLNSGRLLAEIFGRMRRYDQAEQTLRRIIEHAPGDVQSFVRLERVLVLQRKLTEAIVVLEKLAALEPKRAREYYQRMAQYAAELYRDDDAIRFASKAVELSPDDATGHKKLGDMYRRRQNTGRAISQYRKAISKNDRLFPVYFDLAELLLSQQEPEEADRLLRRVMRAAVDEDLVTRATRLSMQINLGRNTLEALEKELLPIALANPQRPVYRRLLVELYGSLAFPLMQRSKSHKAAERAEANATLTRIGQRAVKPLLDALGDDRDSQQRVAVELLTHLANKSSSAALFSFAMSDKDPSLRVRAMIAAGAARDPEMLPRFEEVLFDRQGARVDEGNPVNLAAVWGLVQLSGAKAAERQLQLLRSDSETARALAAVALGQGRIKAAQKPLLKMLSSVEYGHVSRAAASYALGELGAQAAIAPLIPLSQSGDMQVQSAALVALTRLSPADAKRAIAEALVSDKKELRDAGLGAACLLGKGNYESARPLDVPEDRVHIEQVLTALLPRTDSATARAQALITLKEELRAAAEGAIQSSESQARMVTEFLSSEGTGGSFGPLTRGLSQVNEDLRASARAAAGEIAADLVPVYLSLSGHPSPSSRATALRFLATRNEEPAASAVVSALRDPDPQVQRTAISLSGQHPSLRAAHGLVQLLRLEQPWPLRVLVADTLAEYKSFPRFAQAAQEKTLVLDALETLARSDPYSLVRQAAAKALAKLAGPAAAPVLRSLAEDDAEPRVRKTATELLGSQAPEGALSD